MNVSIIAIGDEILIGQVIDTNSGDIARRIEPLGWKLHDVQVVGDNADEIRSAIDRAFAVSEVVFTTGGLGPTKDDITKPVLCEYFGGELYMNDEVSANIIEVFKKRGIQLNPLTAAQALVPTSCQVIQNKVGTAPVMWFEKDGKVLVSMPGVPFEMRAAMDTEVLARLQKKFPIDGAISHHTLMVIDITESRLAMTLDEFEKKLPAYLHLAYLPTPGLIRLRLDGRHHDANLLQAEMDGHVAELKAILGDLVIYDGDATPAEILLHYLGAKGLTVATAESCTGGNIAHRITSIAGSSSAFKGSVVSYSNEVKHNVLGVDNATLEEFGAVSEPVVRQMVEGACRVIGTDCAVATSGIAGPGGGTPEKPVGTVWMAVKTPSQVISQVFKFPGDRSRVIDRASTVALLLLAKELRKS
jgi:nicotinamide-nucleotide amidase